MNFVAIPKTKTTATLAVLMIAVLAISTFAALSAFAQMPASKNAVAAAEAEYVGVTGVGSLSDDVVLSTQIKTAEKKDLVIMFSSEVTLLTDTTVKGKGGTVVSEEDRASIQVWATVTKDDGTTVTVYPNDVTFAERIQYMEGRLSAITHEADGTITYLPEYVRLSLETTEANSFNFVALNVESGVYTVQIHASISLEESAGQVNPNSIAGILGDRTLVVDEIRLTQDASP